MAHSDIKPSNILLIRNETKIGGYALRLSDFGTSIIVNEKMNEKLTLNKDSNMKNVNKFMTPLYASPNIK